MSVLHNRATVKREKLEDVVGRDKWRINNQLHMQLEPRHIQDILQNANSLVGEEVPYNVTKFNCEHFVTLLRYRVPHSQQVQLFSMTQSYCRLLINDSNVNKSQDYRLYYAK